MWGSGLQPHASEKHGVGGSGVPSDEGEGDGITEGVLTAAGNGLEGGHGVPGEALPAPPAGGGVPSPLRSPQTLPVPAPLMPR